MAASQKGVVVGNTRATPPGTTLDGPRSLGRPADYQERPETIASRARLRKSVVALLVLDVLLGAWLYLHAPGFLPKLSLANFAVLGISGVLRLLTDDDRSALARRPIAAVRDVLSRPEAPRTLAAVVLVMLVLAAVTSSVHVRSTAGATAEIRLVDGSESTTNSRAVARAETLALAQSGGAVIRRRSIRPWGNSFWAYTQTHVSRGAWLALPWKPVRWAYPDDFDEQVTLYVLPVQSATTTLDNLQPSLVISDVAGRELVRSPVSSDGVEIQFSTRARDLDEVSAGWTAQYRAELLARMSYRLQSDSVLVIGLLAPTARRDSVLTRHDAAVASVSEIAGRDTAWRRASRIRPVRPLHRGEKVRYAFDHKGKQTGPFEVVLERHPYFLFVDSLDVDPKETVARP